MTDVKLLEEKIRKSGLKKGHLAERLGVSRGTLRGLLTNKVEFKTSQIQVLCDLLGIEDEETICSIFFASNGAFKATH